MKLKHNRVHRPPYMMESEELTQKYIDELVDLASRLYNVCYTDNSKIRKAIYEFVEETNERDSSCPRR